MRPILSRERILAEGARMFNRRGFHGTTLDAVAETLGVTKAALYYHVRSKEELLFQCHARPIDIALSAIRAAKLAGTRPDQQLRDALRAYIEVVTDELGGSVVLLEEGALSPAHQRQVVQWRDEYERELRSIIGRGIEDGVFVDCDPKLVGFALLGAANWIPRWYRASGTHSGKEIAVAFADYLVRGLQPARTP